MRLLAVLRRLEHDNADKGGPLVLRPRTEPTAAGELVCERMNREFGLPWIPQPFAQCSG
jgi:hypothetical protein